MKVYIYVNEEALVYLLGVINSSIVDGEDINIYYSTNQKMGLDTMVSLTADQFVYLKDSGILQKLDLVNN